MGGQIRFAWRRGDPTVERPFVAGVPPFACFAEQKCCASRFSWCKLRSRVSSFARPINRMSTAGSPGGSTVDGDPWRRWGCPGLYTSIFPSVKETFFHEFDSRAMLALCALVDLTAAHWAPTRYCSASRADFGPDST